MQIICNNCGNDLTFPNQQDLVTCPHCLTHLQIEELDNTISATIVENIDFDDTIFANEDVEIIESNDFIILKELLALEEEYSKVLDKNFFHSIMMGSKFRPVFRRGLWRLGFSVLFTISYTYSYINVLDSITSAGIALIYSLLLFISSCIEFRKWYQLRVFEKYYFEEKEDLLEGIDLLNFNKKIQHQYNLLKDNYQNHLQIRKNYFYINIFGLSINIGSSIYSEVLRLLLVGIVSFGIIYLEHGGLNQLGNILCFSIYLFIILFIITIIRKYNQNVIPYKTNLKERKTIIKKLNKELNQ